MTASKLTIHVAPGGRDHAQGTAADPLATPAAIAACRRHGADGCTIVLHGGRYELAEPLRLGPQDNGLTIEAAPGETPVLYGGRLLDGWEPESDGRFWSAPAPGTDSGAWDFRQLYVEGEARPNARLPETGTWRHDTTFHEPYDPCFDPQPPVAKRSRFVYGQGQLAADLSLKNAEFVILHAWDDSHTQAAVYDPETHALRLDPPCTYPPGCFNVQEFFVLNLREGMTRPGQWYLDRERGRVVYWPLPGEDPNRCLVEAPYLTSLVRIEGSGMPVWEHNVPGQGILVARLEGGRPVADVVVRGLTFDLTAAALVQKESRMGSGYPGSEDPSSPGVWSEFFTGAVMLQHARGCRLTGLTVRRSGGQGVKLVHTDDTTVEQCEISHCGANGIASNFCLRTNVVGNGVRHVGELRNFAVGIHGINWSRGRIAHNEVSDCTYCGITLSNGNREDPLPAENVVEYNHVWNVMNALDDGGCIYFSWSQRGTVVRGNILHGSHGRSSLANGLYLDIGVDGVTCEDNLVYDIDEASLHVHMAKDNVVRNNVFVCGRKRGISFAGSRECVFERNIVLGTNREIQFLNPDGARFNSNLYWSAAGPPRFAQSPTAYGSQPFPTGYARAPFLALDAVLEASGPPRSEDWSRAMTVDRFVRSGGAEPAAEHRIEARFLRQDAFLHVCIRIERPSPDVQGGTGALWNREHTELFLKPFAEGPGMVQLCVASDGECAARWSVPEPSAFCWHAGVRPLGRDAGWETTFCVPLDALAAACGEGVLNPAFFIGCTIENRSMTLADWQAQGRDPDGMSIDPLFIDPSGGDYRLRESSPAREIGFVFLDLPTVDSTGKARLMRHRETYSQFRDQWQENAQLAWDTVAMRPTEGLAVGGFGLNDMQWSHLEDISGNPRGSYACDPVRVYREFQLAAGVCFIDQWIPENPLGMKSQDQGYDRSTARGATTGAGEIVRDGIVIESPEAVVQHLEQVYLPGLERDRQRLEANADEEVRQRIDREVQVQRLFGMNMLKGPYHHFQDKPCLLYSLYGYANYFMAYALYPEVIERSFKLQADHAEAYNRIAARAIVEGGLPGLVRLDHDMADSRGTLVDIKTLDKMWFPHFARAIQPFHDAGVRLIWHCDGNLMEMVPRLLACGIGGFQGFQYEDGMDYEKICRMTTREGDGLFIIGGVSVTTTLPNGTPEDVRREIDWLVESGPKVGLMLGCSSSIAPGVPLENLKTLIEGFDYYRRHGRR